MICLNEICDLVDGCLFPVEEAELKSRIAQGHPFSETVPDFAVKDLRKWAHLEGEAARDWESHIIEEGIDVTYH